MTSARPTPLNDDSGDQFPGAVSATTAPTTSRPAGADDRLVRMSAAYTEKINAAVQADRESLAYELAEHTFVDELSGLANGRHTSTRTPGVRPPGQVPTRLTRVGRATRRSLRRFDRYTVDVFNPGHPYRRAAARREPSSEA